MLKPQSVWYYPPGSVHLFFPVRPYFNYRWLSIEGTDAGRLFQALRIEPGINPAGPCPEELFAEVELNLQDSTLPSQMRAMSAAFEILSRITAPEVEVRPLLERAKKLLMENYRYSSLDVDKVAELLHIHRVTLSRLFKNAYGIAPGEYLASVRLRAGMDLLTDTDLPIKEVATQCGYASAGYFCKVLRQLTGLTPRDFRRNGKSTSRRRSSAPLEPELPSSS